MLMFLMPSCSNVIPSSTGVLWRLAGDIGADLVMNGFDLVQSAGLNQTAALYKHSHVTRVRGSSFAQSSSHGVVTLRIAIQSDLMLRSRVMC